ncbi:threonine/serine dehydratase [uncultured Lentibacter sp.]|jgi:threonine dehydratase|uniref:threonine ammonia-lyase n=1 Tax=uncultured Lentibacter sp. TaxID=1659309 RepID=UPI002620E1A2|nr:threonine/serine dehydratase [uncultured Lentibacter sp.]
MNIDKIRAAAARLEGRARTTPLLSSPFLDEIAGKPVFVKAECLQHTGSFKFRGAWAALSARPAALRQKGVIAYSSGNHAQGVAYAAALHGVPAVIVMPADAPKLKIANTRALGAEVVLYERASEDREQIGAELAQARGLSLIKPYDDPEVIAGQGTTGLEIAHQARAEGLTEAEVLVCCGGGGLTSGIALALAAETPAFTVRPCEPEGFDDVARSLATGQIQRNTKVSGSLCDAIITPQPGELTFPLMQQHCKAGIVVREDEVLKAMALAYQRLKIVVEPGGAVGLAAALFHSDKTSAQTLIAVTTGGNVDQDIFAQALATLP